VEASSQDRIARDRLLDSYQPFLQADLGRGHLIRLSQRRLEWVGGRRGKPLIVRIEDLRCVSLAERPVWEAVLVGILLAGGFVLGPPWAIRWLLGALILLSLVACFAQKRYALRLQLRSGQLLEVALGTGTQRAAQTQRVRSVWATLSAELRTLGVARLEPPTT
jgi:hypothetical protein